MHYKVDINHKDYISKNNCIRKDTLNQRKIQKLQLIHKSPM